MDVPPLLVSVTEGARVIGVGKSKFYELVGKKKIKVVKLGRRTLVSVAVLQEFVTSATEAA